MIATKTTTMLMLALGMLGIAGMIFASPSAYAQNIAASSASNEDNDDVEQENESKIEQESKIKCKSEAEVEDNDVIGVTGANTAVSANDCDNTQAAVVTQSNTNTDNDVQVATSEAEQIVCQQLAFLGLQICGEVGTD